MLGGIYAVGLLVNVDESKESELNDVLLKVRESF